MACLSFPLSIGIRTSKPISQLEVWRAGFVACLERNMHNCALRAPSGGISQHKRNVVDDVNPLQPYFRPRYLETTCELQSKKIDPNSSFSHRPQRDDAAVDGLLSLTSEKRKGDPSMSFSSSMTQFSVSQVGAETQTPRTDTESLKSETQDEDVIAEEAYQRELRRTRQIRYRKKQDDHMKTMGVENGLLRAEIQRLEHRKRSASAIYQVQENIWNVALEYFRVFRSGLQSKTQTSAGSQFEFLRAAMTPDTVFNTGRGSEAMIRSWKCISMWFQDVELELEEVVKGPVGSLVAATTTRITITERTLRNVFPHLCKKNENYDGLSDKLLGQRIVMRGFTRFEWDAAQRRVSSVIAQSDLLTPMLRLVGSVEEVSRIFDKSIISTAFQWRLMTK